MLYADVNVISDSQIEVEGITINHDPDHQRIALTWISTVKRDIIADSLAMMALQLNQNPPS